MSQPFVQKLLFIREIPDGIAAERGLGKNDQIRTLILRFRDPSEDPLRVGDRKSVV